MMQTQLKQIFQNAKKGGEALPQFLRQCIDLAIQLPNNSHFNPVVFFNSAKNILGDGRDEPSEIILTYLYEQISSSMTTSVLEKSIPVIQEENKSEPVFAMDLQDAVFSTDWDAAHQQALKLFHAAEHKGYILEILTEIGLNNTNSHALYFYHLLRSVVFFQPTHYQWNAIENALSHLMENPPQATSAGETTSPETAMLSIISNGDVDDWTVFAAAWRLWESESVLQSRFQQKLSNWLTTWEQKEISKNDGTIDYKVYETPNFPEMADKIIMLDLGTRITQQRIVALEAIRFLWSKLDSKFAPNLSEKINQIIK